MTGRPAVRAALMISFCTRGTCSNGSSRPRSPRATITPWATFRISARLSMAAGRSTFAMIGTTRSRPAMCDAANRTSSAVCTKLSATRSTPSFETELEIVDVLGRERRRRKRHAWRIDALVLTKRRAVHHDRRELVGGPRNHFQLDSPVVQKETRSGICRSNQLGEASEDAPRAARGVTMRDAKLVARLQRNRRATNERPGPDLGPLRSCMIATWRPDCRVTSRIRRNDSAWVPCVPCEKLRRKTSTPAAISAWRTSGRVAGRTNGGDDLRLTHRFK